MFCLVGTNVINRKGELNKRAVDTGWPYQVALPADACTGARYDVVHDFCRGLSFCPRGHYFRRFVAEEEGEIVGTYYIRANQAGGGKHICNCGYMTDAAATGRGVARAMCQHSLDYARLRGYRGMQFNFVVSANTRAVALWQSFGFEIVGRLPLAFHHPRLGFVDALVMFRPLYESGT